VPPTLRMATSMTGLTDQERIELLDRAIFEHGIPAEKIEFAESLVSQFEERGSLSEKQWPWVDRLPHLGEMTVPSLHSVITFMDAAGSQLKFPKLFFTVGDEASEWGQLEVHLSRAGQKSSKPGSVTVTSEGDFDTATYFGRITRDGVFSPSAACTTKANKLLIRLQQDFAATVAAAGKHSGRCAMCNKALSDERSLAAGYGKTCAKNWALPW